MGIKSERRSCGYDGPCTSCGGRREDPRYKGCAECRLVGRIKWQVRHPRPEPAPDSPRRCKRCTRDREDLQWLYCARCREYFRAREERKRAAATKLGVCRLCGDRSATEVCKPCEILASGTVPQRAPRAPRLRAEVAEVVAERIAAEVIALGRPVAPAAVRFRALRAGVPHRLVFAALAKHAEVL